MKQLFKKGRGLLLVLGLIGLLAGCSEETDHEYEDKSLASNEVSANNEQDVQVVTKEFTMYAESVLKDTTEGLTSGGGYYVFNGFIADDRLSFESRYYGYSSMAFKSVYHPAKVGYTFEFKDFENKSFEIIEVNPEQNFIKLKMTTKEVRGDA